MRAVQRGGTMSEEKCVSSVCVFEVIERQRSMEQRRGERVKGVEL